MLEMPHLVGHVSQCEPDPRFITPERGSQVHVTSNGVVSADVEDEVTSHDDTMSAGGWVLEDLQLSHPSLFPLSFTEPEVSWLPAPRKYSASLYDTT